MRQVAESRRPLRETAAPLRPAAHARLELVEALDPDLIILDEFQRFRHLLDGQDPAADLAQHLFEQDSARVLLLSATPYKMYTLPEEESTEDEDHYADFLGVTHFLMDPAEAGGSMMISCTFAWHSKISSTTDVPDLRRLRQRVERRLRRVMCRTERLADTPNRMGMLADRASHGVELTERDLGDYTTLNAVSRLLDSGNVLEYWKSAPYLLNFMDDYKLKRAFRDLLLDPRSLAAVSRMLSGGKSLLPMQEVKDYQTIDPGNARLRGLMKDTVDAETWKLLWLPPSLPYYELGDPFDDPEHRKFTKRLVFSAWSVVPQVIASLVSFEADRRLVHAVAAGGRTRPNPELKYDQRFVSRGSERAARNVAMKIGPKTRQASRECPPFP